MKSNLFTRRQLLLMGIGVGAVARVTAEYMRNHSFELQRQAIQKMTPMDMESIISTAYGLERDWDTEMLQRQETLATAKKLTKPKIAYDRPTSKLLIKACKLAVQQYKTGRSNFSYDGSLKLLPNYDLNFAPYTQIASFKIEQEQLENYFRLNEDWAATEGMNLPEEVIYDIEGTVRKIVKRIVQEQYQTDLFMGYILTSKTNNIIAFRGTQTQADWVQNLRATQQEYRDRKTDKSYGLVHQGFLDIFRQKISEPLLATVQQLDPTIPCYITGHSLGSAIATLAALEIALNTPQIREQIQLYTYAAPRVGNSDFAQAHNNLIPNSYRIVNQGDFIPLIPPVKIENQEFNAEYAHLGQKWTFLTQYGDVLLNHIVDTYSQAIAAEEEILSN